MSDKNKGLGKAREIYLDSSRRPKDLRAAGKKIIGYPCVYVPLEMLTALDLVPYRTCGDIKEPVTEADRVLPHSFCPIMRNCLDCALKNKNNFLDGMVTIHSSDPQEKTARIWESYTHYPYFHFIDMPITVRPEALEYFKGQLNDFRKTLEAFTAKKLSTDNLETAIKSHNQQRVLVRKLYELTKTSPPRISGTEIVQVVKALTSLPVAEGNDLLTETISEVKNRSDGPDKKSARLLIWSSTLDDTDIMQVFEAKANVVMNESCGGVRAYRGEVKLTADPLEGLADYYLNEITCARTFRQATLGETRKDYARDLQSRFGYLGGTIKEWKINGVIMLLVRYCDPFAFEMPSLKDYLSSLGIPSTYIEYDYTTGALAPLRTRVEAFVETISQ
ncbi:MAG: 2-hydroxyacyl-CoA dehydratase family protein [Dehalococcoidia bacterium]|nr:2-hydroxyacyl-CoA dehydratase family protein [Dehalococcoidia bacterium]MDH4291464.1 2-hydroxyacyl-CoA dehydratase family protein [Dehalococcoidia bacterium]